MPHWLDELNPAQPDAVTAATGHSGLWPRPAANQTLACRVAWLVEHGTPPGDPLTSPAGRRRDDRPLPAVTGAQTTGRSGRRSRGRLLRYYGRAMGFRPTSPLSTPPTVIHESSAASSAWPRATSASPHKPPSTANGQRRASSLPRSGLLPLVPGTKSPSARSSGLHARLRQNVLDYDDRCCTGPRWPNHRTGRHRRTPIRPHPRR